MPELREFVDDAGASPFHDWFQTLDAVSAAKITVALARVELGNTSNVKPVGDGVSECRINFGPGFRVYFGMDGAELVVLLGGGTKRRQQSDIDEAKRLWGVYKAIKKGKAQWP